MHSLNRLKAAPRLALCLVVAVIALGISLFSHIHILTSLLLAWDAFSITLILLSCLLFFTTSSSDVRHLAQRQDENRYAISLLVLATVCVSMVGILFLMNPTGSTIMNQRSHHSIALAGVALSWLLLHTMFTLRYAHLYYTDDRIDDSDAQIGGLEFPGEERAPDYVDFMYFSFVIGMTFQVSDVEISSRSIRRVVLMHSLISFVFNTIIVALTISALSNLGH